MDLLEILRRELDLPEELHIQKALVLEVDQDLQGEALINLRRGPGPGLAPLTLHFP